MKKFTALFCVLLLSLSVSVPSFAETAAKKEPELKAKAAILVDATNGRILFEKNAEEKHYPASTTKVMTALLALENLDPARTATASEIAVNVERDGSNMGILSGEELTVEQLLYGLLVHSANDAANVLAEEVAGSIPAFVEQMNTKAAELGMEHTHFANPHGYHDENHYTTAHDLAELARCAMKLPLFQTIVATPTYEIPPTNRYEEVRHLSNNNSLINPMKGRAYLYSAATGIKTGHTSDAGNCLVASAEKNGISFISVVLDAPIEENKNYSFVDTIALFDYGFQQYKMQVFTDADEILATKEVSWAAKNEQAILTVAAPQSALIPVDYDKEKLESKLSIPDVLRAPLAEGEEIGTVTYLYDGTVLCEAPLVNKKAIRRSFFRMIFGTLFHWLLSAWVLVPLGVIVLILLVLRWRELQRQKRLRRQRKYESRRNFYR